MSETILKINLTELAMVRITCPGCQITTELSVDAMGRKFATRCECHHCGHPLIPCDGDNLFRALSRALLNLAERSDKVQIEFVIPGKE
jgi:hypothetical protein